MKEFDSNEAGPFQTAVGDEFGVLVPTYGEASLSGLQGVDFLGQSEKPSDGRCGAPKNVVFKFKARQPEMEIGIDIGGTNYETNMAMEPEHRVVKVKAR